MHTTKLYKTSQQSNFNRGIFTSVLTDAGLGSFDLFKNLYSHNLSDVNVIPFFKHLIGIYILPLT